MNTYLKCTECNHVQLESGMNVDQTWNADMRGFDNFLICGECHSTEGGFDTANECESCEKREPLIDGTDMCQNCYNAHTSLERDLTALETALRERNWV